MTMIARVSDGLPLAASVQDDEQVRCGFWLSKIWIKSNWLFYEFQIGRSVLEYQNQAKMLFKKLNAQSPPQMTIETGPYLFQWENNLFVSIYNDLYLFFSYLIESQVCYLVLCEKSFSKRLAFSFLEDLQNEFINQYGHKINSITRPYSFIEFGILKSIINYFSHVDFFPNKQIIISKKQRNLLWIPEQEEIWINSILNYKMFKKLWFRTLMMFCKED